MTEAEAAKGRKAPEEAMSKAVASRSLVKKPSRLWGWLRTLGFGLQLSLAFAFVSFGIRSYLARTRLQAALAQMDRTDPGWRLQDIEAARAVVPDQENSALRVIDIGKRLPDSPHAWIEDDFATQLQSVPAPNRLTAEQSAHLTQRLKEVGPLLEEARGLSELPRGRYPIIYARNPLGTLLAGQQKSRGVLQLLVLDATARADSGDVRGAMTSCRAALNVGRAIGDEPLAISQLIRVAEVMIACKTAGRILAQGEPDPEDLKDLQTRLEEEDAHPYWRTVCRGERAFDNAVLEALESGAVSVSEMADSRPDWQDFLVDPLIQDNIRAYHPQLFTDSARLQAAAELPPGMRGPAVEQIYSEIRKRGLNFETILLPALGKLADACDRWHATLRCTAVALAAERYRRLHGDWPPSLDAMTPDLLAAVPTDPFTDDALLYHRLPDGVVIYSVSTDGVDNGGAVEEANPTLPGADLGVRLWDVAKRRQPPLPPPAAAPGMPPR